MMNRKLHDSVILVTGGARFIGSNLIERLLEGGAREVIIIVNLFCGRENNIPPKTKYIVLYVDNVTNAFVAASSLNEYLIINIAGLENIL